MLYQGNTLKLQRATDISKEDQSSLTLDINLRQRHSWAALLSEYGTVRNGLSQIRLLQANGSEVVGTVALHPQDDTLLLYTAFPDTLPTIKSPTDKS